MFRFRCKMPPRRQDGRVMANSGQAGTIFVDRQREMAEMMDALASSMAGQGRLITLAGEPGIGKTRTAEELASHAEG